MRRREKLAGLSAQPIGLTLLITATLAFAIGNQALDPDISLTAAAIILIALGALEEISFVLRLKCSGSPLPCP